MAGRPRQKASRQTYGAPMTPMRWMATYGFVPALPFLWTIYAIAAPSPPTLFDGTVFANLAHSWAVQDMRDAVVRGEFSAEYYIRTVNWRAGMIVIWLLAFLLLQPMLSLSVSGTRLSKHLKIKNLSYLIILYIITNFCVLFFIYLGGFDQRRAGAFNLESQDVWVYSAVFSAFFLALSGSFIRFFFTILIFGHTHIPPHLRNKRSS